MEQERHLSHCSPSPRRNEDTERRRRHRRRARHEERDVGSPYFPSERVVIANRDGHNYACDHESDPSPSALQWRGTTTTSGGCGGDDSPGKKRWGHHETVLSSAAVSTPDTSATESETDISSVYDESVGRDAYSDSEERQQEQQSQTTLQLRDQSRSTPSWDMIENKHRSVFQSPRAVPSDRPVSPQTPQSCPEYVMYNLDADLSLKLDMEEGLDRPSTVSSPDQVYVHRKEDLRQRHHRYLHDDELYLPQDDDEDKVRRGPHYRRQAYSTLFPDITSIRKDHKGTKYFFTFLPIIAFAFLLSQAWLSFRFPFFGYGVPGLDLPSQVSRDARAEVLREERVSVSGEIRRFKMKVELEANKEKFPDEEKSSWDLRYDIRIKAVSGRVDLTLILMETLSACPSVGHIQIVGDGKAISEGITSEGYGQSLIESTSDAILLLEDTLAPTCNELNRGESRFYSVMPMFLIFGVQ